MPKIRIKERDLTTNAAGNANTNAVFLIDATISTTFSDVRKVTSATVSGEGSSITKTLTFEGTTTSVVGSPKFDFIREALGLGGIVYMATTWSNAANYLGDRNQYDVKLLLADEANLSSAMTVAEKRKDAAIILQTASTAVSSDTASICHATLSYKTSETFYNDEKQGYCGKYVIPVYANSLSGIVTNANEAWTLAYLNSVNEGNPEWHAVAGYKRGSVPGATSAGFIKEDDLDAMQPRGLVQTTSGGTTLPDAVGNVAVNPICYVNPWGVRIWGNRTGLPNDVTGAEGDDKLVASSFANIRLLLCDLKKALYQAAKRYQFEQNSDVLWVNFTGEVNKTLEEMKQSSGIAAYRWERQETNERAKIKALLKIIPIEAVEDFDLTIELADALEVNE